MIAKDVITKVDRLKPNAYGDEDKLDWISDIDTFLRSEVIRYYNYYTITTTVGEVTYTLPAGVYFENIEAIIYNDKRVEKTDFLSYAINGYENSITITATEAETILLMYLVRFDRYRYISYVSGANEITFGTNSILTAGENFTFAVGDKVNITGCTVNAANNKEATILTGSTANNLLFAADTFTAGAETAAITLIRVLDDTLIVQAPYDKMYAEYLFSMIDFNNREYEAYNNNSAMYNATLSAYTKWYKQRSPTNNAFKIRNIW